MIRHLVTVVAGVLLAGGCTAGETGVPTVRSGADIRLPLDEFLLTDEQIQLISSAHSVLGRKCLARLGLTWPSPGPFTSAAAEPRNARRYYLLDMDDARARGYHAGLQENPLGDSGQPDPKAVAAWTRKGGCAVKASRVLNVGGGGVDPQVLQQETFSRMQADPRVHDVYARWSSCMRDAGYTYPDPPAADRDPRWAQAPAASPDEIATASADVLCKQRTRLADTMFAVETAYQQEVIAQHRADLLELRTTHQAVIGKAGRIVASASPEGESSPRQRPG